MTVTFISTPMNAFRQLAITLALGVLLLSGCASVPDEPVSYDVVYTPEQLRDDLKFIDQSLRTIHPNLFSRQTEEDYLNTYAATFGALSSPSNRREYFNSIAPLLASFQDTHIQLQLPVEEFRKFSAQQGLFPLKVLISEGSFIVIADEQDLPTIPVGAEILTINDVSVADLMPQLSQLVPSETETGRLRLIQVHLSKLLWAVFPEANTYTITYRWRDRVFTEPLSPELSVPVAEVLEPETSPEIISNYGSRSINDSTTLLWLNDFNEDSAVFEEYLENLFSKLREDNKSHLILDLRYNQGGLTDNLKLLLSYLSPRPINWAERARLRVSSDFKKQHAQLIDSTKSDKYTAYLGWLPMEYLNLWQWELLFSTEGDVLETDIDPVVENNEMYFQGDVVVLSNGYCFSACAALLSNLQNHNLATIMGESPGSYIGRQFGYPIQIKLPNTGLMLSLPAMEIILHEDVGLTKNLEPDHEVSRSQQDVINDRDVVLNSALDLIGMKE